MFILHDDLVPFGILDKKSWIYDYYVYLDHNSGVADVIMSKMKLSVIKYDNPISNTNWKLVYCKVVKTKNRAFFDAMASMYDYMEAFGHTDYMEMLECCQDLFLSEGLD